MSRDDTNTSLPRGCSRLREGDSHGQGAICNLLNGTGQAPELRKSLIPSTTIYWVPTVPLCFSLLSLSLACQSMLFPRIGYGGIADTCCLFLSPFPLFCWYYTIFLLGNYSFSTPCPRDSKWGLTHFLMWRHEHVPHSCPERDLGMST